MISSLFPSPPLFSPFLVFFFSFPTNFRNQWTRTALPPFFLPPPPERKKELKQHNRLDLPPSSLSPPLLSIGYGIRSSIPPACLFHFFFFPFFSFFFLPLYGGDGGRLNRQNRQPLSLSLFLLPLITGGSRARGPRFGPSPLSSLPPPLPLFRTN